MHLSCCQTGHNFFLFRDALSKEIELFTNGSVSAPSKQGPTGNPGPKPKTVGSQGKIDCSLIFLLFHALA